MKLPATFLFTSLIALSATAFAGHDEGRRSNLSQHHRAHEYASTAIGQVNKARTLGCHFNGRHWSLNYNDHYNWALRNDPHKTRRETSHRDNDLANCRTRYGYGNKGQHGKHYGYNNNSRFGINSYAYTGNTRGDNFARWYADTATSQVRENHRYGCRGKGNAWTTNWYDHYRWALNTRRDRAMREVEKRNQRLQRCGSYSYRH